MEVEEVAMKPLSTEKSQNIIAVEQKLKYHTFPLKTKGGITNQIICIISLNLCQLSIGFGLGFSAISIPQIKAEGVIPFTPSIEGAYAALLSLGQVCGSLVTALICEYIGRKATTLISCLPILIGWICLALVNMSFLLILGRFLVGLGMGIEGSLHSLFVAELMSREYRGPFVTSGIISITLGILTIYTMGTFIHWRLCAWICLTIPTLALILIGIFVPESPLWLVEKGFIDLSDNVIHFLGRNEEEFASEVEEQLRLKVRSPQKYTENASSTTTQSFLNRITSKEVIQPTVTLTLLFFFQNWTGFIATVFYGVDIFMEVSPKMDPYYATIILGLVQVFGCSVSIFLIKLVNRKLLLLISLGLCFLTMTLLAIFVHLQWSWATLICLILFTFAFMTGLSPIPWILVGELPTTMKGVVAGLSTAFCYLFIFLSAFTFPLMNRWQLWKGPFGTFLLYGLIALIGCAYVGFLAPGIDYKKEKGQKKRPEKELSSPTENTERKSISTAISIIHDHQWTPQVSEKVLTSTTPIPEEIQTSFDIGPDKMSHISFNTRDLKFIDHQNDQNDIEMGSAWLRHTEEERGKINKAFEPEEKSEKQD